MAASLLARTSSSSAADVVARGRTTRTLELPIALARPGETIIDYELSAVAGAEHSSGDAAVRTPVERLTGNGEAGTPGTKYVEVAAASGGEDYTSYIRSPYYASLPVRTEAHRAEGTPSVLALRSASPAGRPVSMHNLAP